jgi:uncharacterized membrane protein
VPLVLAACLVTLGGGFLLKAQCLQPWADWHQYESLCYNDLQPLWEPRGVAANIFPYVHGALEDGSLVDGAIEYPVATGVFMWFGGLFVDSSNEYLVVSALLLAPFGFVTAYLLTRMAGRRALLWAAAPALVLYAFHNWDLLVVAAAAAGLYWWWRGRPVVAAAFLGLGGALKFYPLFFLAPLALALAARGNRRAALASFGTGAGVFAAINLPFVIANFDGWWATFEFHRLRGPNFDNIWNITDFGPIAMPVLSPSELNLLTTVLTGAFFVLALWVGWKRRVDEPSGYPVFAVSAALLAAFLLFNKVHSPQYTLWILPFFVVTNVHIGWWVAYSAVDLAVYVGTFRFFFDVCSTNNCALGDPTWSQWLMNAGVVARAGLLLVLFFVFLRRRPLGASVVSHPPDSVLLVGEEAGASGR